MFQTVMTGKAGA